jgi:hypothetical protein
LAPVKEVVTFLLNKDWRERPFAADAEGMIAFYL